MSSPTPRISSHYAGEAGASYAARRQPDPLHMGYWLNLEYFRPYLKKTDVVLDFGCGNGGMLRLLGEVVAEVEGLEVNPHAAAVARGFGQKVYGGIDELPQTPRYDAVVSNHVLEHVRDVPGTLERVRQCVRPNGLLLLKLPLEDWRSADSRHWSASDVDHHLQTWTPRLIGNVLYEAGYEVEEARVVTSAWDPRLFPLVKVGLGKLAFWALAVWKKRRQLFVVGRVPKETT